MIISLDDNSFAEFFKEKAFPFTHICHFCKVEKGKIIQKDQKLFANIMNQFRVKDDKLDLQLTGQIKSDIESKVQKEGCFFGTLSGTIKHEQNFQNCVLVLIVFDDENDAEPRYTFKETALSLLLKHNRLYGSNRKAVIRPALFFNKDMIKEKQPKQSKQNKFFRKETNYENSSYIKDFKEYLKVDYNLEDTNCMYVLV